MNIIPLIFYAAAAAAYAVFFVGGRIDIGRLATAILAAGALGHAFVIGMQTMASGHVPIADTTAAISTFVWLLAVAYLYTEMATEERAMGVFIVPLLVALQAIPAAHPGIERPAPILESPWFAVHVSSLLFAYASFALACVIGVTYVLLFKEIKAKHLGFFYKRLPSLQRLDAMNLRAVTIGWIFLTIGVVVGVVWTVQARADAVFDPRLRAMTILDPKIAVALLSWAIYSFQLYARRAIGWSGRRAAWLSTVGFAVVLVNFVAVGYFLTKSHNF
jgi:ABC-type transport system involved in cytochrome c biogenesis permease subunit